MTFWSAEQEALRACARTFVEREGLPHLQRWEDERTIPRELHVEAHRLVEMHRRVAAARTCTREVARRYDAGEQPLVEALPAKRLGSDAASYCTDQAVQLHGGSGYMNGSEVERHYRDARVLGIGGGANEVLDDLAAKLLRFA